jgi:hypothetical protein
MMSYEARQQESQDQAYERFLEQILPGLEQNKTTTALIQEMANNFEGKYNFEREASRILKNRTKDAR